MIVTAEIGLLQSSAQMPGNPKARTAGTASSMTPACADDVAKFGAAKIEQKVAQIRTGFIKCWHYSEWCDGRHR
jgi:hypothetical protein